MLERKTLPVTWELKAADDGGWEVSGYASTFGGEPDSYGDVVARGAFLNSLAKRKTKLLWQHDMGEPIGRQISLEEDERGLFGRWSLVKTDTGAKAHELLAAELVDSLSIGFMTKDAEYREDGVRILKEVDLFEVSLVTIPANASAVVTSFKDSFGQLPISTLLERAKALLTTATAEAKALHARRSSESRALTDRHATAIRDLLDAVKAAQDELSPLVVVPVPVEAVTAQELDLRLRMASRRWAGATGGTQQ